MPHATMLDMVTSGDQSIPRNRGSEIVLCAKLARLIYRDPPDLCTGAEELGATVLKFTPSKRHAGAVFAQGPIGIMAFRGTDKLNDMLDNLNLLWKKTPTGYVHRGFLGALDSLWEDLVGTLSFASIEHLWFTGHSLGGALATLAAMRFQELRTLDTPTVSVATFGQPAVGDITFARKYRATLGKRHLRFVHCMDVIPDSPLLAHHVGERYYFASCGDLWARPSFLRELVDAWRRGWTNRAFAQIADHAMEVYVTMVERHAARIGRDIAVETRSTPG